MDLRTGNFYADWRRSGRNGELHEGDAVPPEKLLQAVWQQQRIQRGELRTSDGQPLRVLHPGFISREGGPDFRGAILQFGQNPPVSGDVEIDLQISGWRAHHHDINPNFKNVILHVVWETTGQLLPQANRQPPAVLSLKPFLDSPVSELAQALENESGLPEHLRGQCSAPLRELSQTQLTELLHAAARVRFENKANAMLARARLAGWEQTLWEHLFRALGYKNNVWPMQNLAETKSRWQGRSREVFIVQSRLLGVSGLLPPELSRSQKTSDTFLRRAWDGWWRERAALTDCTLPRAVWKLHGVRPANHPQRRLALAAHWLTSENLVTKIEDWIVRREVSHGAPAKPTANAGWLKSLHDIFQVEQDEFWSWHWTFNSPRMPRPQPLLGAARVTDLAVNVVLPWLWIRAKEGRNEAILREVERRFAGWPAAEDNSVLKLARQRLLGTANPGILQGAAQQQGLMQIVRDFCEHSNAICADCRFPDLVRSLKGKVQS